jgi:hypothetical protein
MRDPIVVKTEQGNLLVSTEQIQFVFDTEAGAELKLWHEPSRIAIVEKALDVFAKMYPNKPAITE